MSPCRLEIQPWPSFLSILVHILFNFQPFYLSLGWVRENLYPLPGTWLLHENPDLEREWNGGAGEGGILKPPTSALLWTVTSAHLTLPRMSRRCLQSRVSFSHKLFFKIPLSYLWSYTEVHVSINCPTFYPAENMLLYHLKLIQMCSQVFITTSTDSVQTLIIPRLHCYNRLYLASLLLVPTLSTTLTSLSPPLTLELWAYDSPPCSLWYLHRME